jgi:hypothetical protein
MIGKMYRIVRSRGIVVLAFAMVARLESLIAGKAKSFKACAAYFSGKNGIEIGGPSRSFSANGFFPVYPLAASLDNCTFGDVTVWEGRIKEGRTYRFAPDKAAGIQYLCEATDMKCCQLAGYDFVLASHVLEHIANPILALYEWKRLLRGRGALVLLLPDRTGTFDHRRPVTAMAHLIDDFATVKAEDDLTHLPEILALHDRARDPDSGDAESFRMRSQDNFHNRCLHHHVFDLPLAKTLVEYVGLKVVATETIRPHHILLVAEKPLDA